MKNSQGLLPKIQPVEKNNIRENLKRSKDDSIIMNEKKKSKKKELGITTMTSKGWVFVMWMMGLIVIYLIF